VITTYALSLSSVDRNEADRIALIDLITDWQVAAYPVDTDDEVTTGLSVRTRLASNDPVFRTTITESTARSSHVSTTTATASLINGVLTFDIRIVATPRTVKVAPHRAPMVPEHVIKLVRNVLTAVPTFDAERRVVDAVSTIATELEGQDIGYLRFVEKRALPIVVEIADIGTNNPPLLARGTGPLVGLVHLVHITTQEALDGYLDASRQTLIGPGTVVIHWADMGQEPRILRFREIPPASRPREIGQLLSLIIETAALSVAAPRVPPPPRDHDEDLYELPTRENTNESLGDSDTEAHIEQLESMVNDLQGSLTEAERIIAEQNSRIEFRDDQVNKLVLQKLALESLTGVSPQLEDVTTMGQAMDLAKRNFEFLVFHDRAMESGKKLEGPEPMSILRDLWRLNGVARRWSAGEISGTSLKAVCADAGLNFASGISDNARQKFEEDYLIDWQGEKVRAEAHIKRGKKSHLVRIHVYFDVERQQVVVAYIGRHLRDKGSQS